MKKHIVFILSIIFILAVSTCNIIASGTNPDAPLVREDVPLTREDNNTTSSSENNELNQNSSYVNSTPSMDTDILGSTQSLDLGTLFESYTTTNWTMMLDENSKQQMIEEFAKDGMILSFGPDGSMTVVDQETGEVLTQASDGSWIMTNSDGSYGQLGGDINWPDNEYTKLVPKPKFKISFSNIENDEFSVMFSNVNMEDFREYVEQVKKKGFTIDPDVQDMSFLGMTIYTYEATNNLGYRVKINATSGIYSMTITKPEIIVEEPETSLSDLQNLTQNFNFSNWF